MPPIQNQSPPPPSVNSKASYQFSSDISQIMFFYIIGSTIITIFIIWFMYKLITS